MRGYALALAGLALCALPAVAEPIAPVAQAAASAALSNPLSASDRVAAPRVIAQTDVAQPKARSLDAAGPLRRIADFNMPWQTGIYQ